MITTPGSPDHGVGQAWLGPDRGRAGRTEGVRREAQAGMEDAV